MSGSTIIFSPVFFMVPSLGNNFTGDNKLGCHTEEGTLDLPKLVGASEQVLRSDASSQATI